MIQAWKICRCWKL